MRYFVYCRKSTEAEDRQILSIESQLSTLQRNFEGRAEIEIVEVYQEAFSAAAPGRPRFNDMLARIERGEAQGIVAWAPDRLARNSIDGGQIVYLLDRGVIRDLKFATYTFENNPQGKFMLQIMFGQSKYYSDALSENVKRGNRTKLEKGWRPNQAPLGYLNELENKTIVIDPVHFPLVRKMFELMLTGAYNPKRIAIMARDEWGFRTPKRKRSGGKPLALSSIYKILSNPFYAGIIVWDGQSYPGKHVPVVTIDEFQEVRRLLQRPGTAKPQRHEFAFTGLIRCGSCGLRITAEHKVNGYGRRYTYYHCTKRNLGPRCSEPSIQSDDLERQIEEFICSLAIDPKIEAWILGNLDLGKAEMAARENAKKISLQAAVADVESQLNELTGLRLRGLLTDEEFVQRRDALHRERMGLRQNMNTAGEASDRFELLTEFISFSNRAAEWFAIGNNQLKRQILEIVGSNFVLMDKKLNVEAKKPFGLAAQMRDDSTWLGVVDDVRTNKTKNDMLVRIAHEVRLSLGAEEGQKTREGIRMLLEKFEPAVVTKNTLRKPRRANGAAGFYRARGAYDSSHSPLPL
jgi:DNA invertase Pin-like site-specific DNA recombinase